MLLVGVRILAPLQQPRPERLELRLLLAGDLLRERDQLLVGRVAGHHRRQLDGLHVMREHIPREGDIGVVVDAGLRLGRGVGGGRCRHGRLGGVLVRRRRVATRCHDGDGGKRPERRGDANTGGRHANHPTRYPYRV